MPLELMKAFLWSWILFLGCAVRSCAGGEDPTPRVLDATVSDDVRFPVQIPDGFEIGDITWLFKGRTIAQLTPPGNLTEKEKRFKGRVSINGQNGSLRIWNLSKEDSGEYSAEIYKKRDATEREDRKYTLRIFNRVTAQVDIRAVNGSCTIILTCTEKDGNNVTYRWRKGKEETSIEPIVNFTLSGRDNTLEVCCQVKNPANTSEKCVIPWQETIEGFNHSNCESFTALEESEVYRHRRNLAVGIVVCLLALLAAATVICWYKRKQKADPENKNDVQTVYATVNKPKNAAREENRYQCTEEPYEMERVQTVYAEVQNTRKVEASPTTVINPSPSEEDKEMELYDKVQHPKGVAPPTPAINPSTSKEDTGNTVYDKVQRPKNEANSDQNPSKQPNDPGGAENGVSLYDTQDTIQNTGDEEKKLLNAPPYDQIMRGNNRPAE